MQRARLQAQLENETTIELSLFKDEDERRIIYCGAAFEVLVHDEAELRRRIRSKQRIQSFKFFLPTWAPEMENRNTLFVFFCS